MISAEQQRLILNSLRRFQPERVGIFGSYARGEENADSDLDILVRFKHAVSLLTLVQLEQDLSEKLGVPVDLVTERSIKHPRLLQYILNDLVEIRE